MKKIAIIFFLFSVFGLMGWQFVNIQLIVLMLIGIVSSFIGTLAGGGGLVTLPAMVLTGIPIQTSIATNKFSSGVAAFSSVLYLIHKNKFRVKIIIKYLLVAFIGGIGGSIITTQVSENTMNIIAVILLVFALMITIRNKEWMKEIKVDENKASNVFQKSLILFLIAAYDGGFGPGSSTFSILYFLKQNHRYIEAVQLTRVLIMGSCAGGFIVFYQSGFFQWSFGFALAIGSIIGSQIGLLILPRVSMKLAKKLLITIILLLISQMIYRIL